ncbi:uncharacterized protein CMU_008510 [Cryptosporidium muris RN66]|uniref:Uncharacterized protein n=1 Tax=Cryptosporidium muris (strain RN66) TaxID=441375 RepID=B6ADR9_CRYMR|nr:uncharacterized protein CMU_008510 [Cryptosporidium muris RN66]EEA06360.1 hypothetical protein CMU_008510 [Cryptosporidium muris RN66]|eukprot:XP_002140709.1 hypothetical protein [Cryptosporidium muris RN66]
MQRSSSILKQSKVENDIVAREVLHYKKTDKFPEYTPLKNFPNATSSNCNSTSFSITSKLLLIIMILSLIMFGAILHRIFITLSFSSKNEIVQQQENVKEENIIPENSVSDDKIKDNEVISANEFELNTKYQEEEEPIWKSYHMLRKKYANTENDESIKRRLKNLRRRYKYYEMENRQNIPNTNIYKTLKISSNKDNLSNPIYEVSQIDKQKNRSSVVYKGFRGIKDESIQSNEYNFI